MIKILTRWINGDFDGVVNDFNKPKGYSNTGTNDPIPIVQRSEADEQQYIHYFFN